MAATFPFIFITFWWTDGQTDQELGIAARQRNRVFHQALEKSLAAEAVELYLYVYVLLLVVGIFHLFKFDMS